MTDKEREQAEEYLLDDEQELGEEDKELLEQIYDRLYMFQDLNDPYHEIARECRQVIHMDDPKQDDAETLDENGKPTLQLQTLKSTYNNVVADQMLSMPEAKLLPETPDMQEAADDLQDLVHHVVYVVNDFEEVHHRRCEDFYGPGTAITEVAWDDDMSYGRGDIAIIRWPIEAFLWDPTADDIQNARAVMKLSWHPLSWYREHFPETGKYVSGEESNRNNIGMTEGQTDDKAQHSGDEKRALLVEYWWRTYNAGTHRYSVHVAYAAGNALLDVHKNVYAHGMYPFIVDVHDSIEGSITGEGLVHELVPMMRYINRYAAYADMNARMSSKGRLLVREGSGIDMDALADWKTDIIQGKNIQTDSLMWLQTQPFPASITNLMTMFQSDLKADSGANQFTRGETTGGIVSGKAINSLIQAGGKIASMRTEQLKLGFKRIVEQVIWLIAEFYDKDRTMMITGRNGRKELVYNTEKLFGKKLKGVIPPPPYTVEIEVTSRDPQRVANRNQMFMEAFTMAAQTPYPMRLSDLFQILNLDGKDKILPVIKANEQYQEMMMQLQQENEQLKMQVDDLAQKNQNLKKTNSGLANTMANMSARRGKAPETTGAIVNASQNTLGQPLGGEPLPT